MSVVTKDERLLSLEQIKGIAPDHATLRAAEEVARGERWGLCGRSVSGDGRLLWAEFPESRRPATHTVVALPTMRAACTCAATRFPCRHVIALLLRDEARPFDPAGAPDWALRGAVASPGRGESAGDATADARLAKLTAAMADLNLWLGDLARQGLAGLPQRHRRLWLDAADRLAAAYAPEAARELRTLSALPGSGPDWPERLLPRLGRLALLCAAFRRLDELSPAERGDVLAAAGWLARRDEERVRDHWLVVGRRLEFEGKQRRTRTWLWGADTGRWAALVETRPARRLEGLCLPTGATAAGEVAFAPGAWPTAARPVDLGLVAAPVDLLDFAAPDFDTALAGYAAALARNPWLRAYPLALREVFVEPGSRGGSWRVRDRGGRLLPLPAGFAQGWGLLALTADRPLTLFGEWDGAIFTPSSVRAGSWRALSAWKGLL